MASRCPLIEPENLVGLGFRCSMSCFRPGLDASSNGCRLLAATIAARGLSPGIQDHFTAWALAITATAQRPITLNPLETASFSQDERLAITLVAACQHAPCPALTACASALLGTSDLGRVLAATQIIAHTLAATGIVVQNLGPGPSQFSAASPPTRAPRLH